MSSGGPDLSARDAYEAFASVYDDFNHAYRYESWTGQLLSAAQECGLTGDRMLDVGCGTGLSFIAMLERGWRVTACDISPAMLALARSKVGDAATLLAADMRDLPALGKFDLVWAVNDAANYLLTDDELRAALVSMSRNLAARGVLLFDLNTLLAYRTFFCETHVREVGDRRFVWEGQASLGSAIPGSIFEARFEAEGQAIDHVHRQRHFSESEVRSAIDGTGLRCLNVLGEQDGELAHGLDESIHTKAVYICSHEEGFSRPESHRRAEMESQSGALGS